MGSELEIHNFNSLLVISPVTTVVIILILLSISRWRELLCESKLIAYLLIVLVYLDVIEIVTYGNITKNYNLLLKAYYCGGIVSASIFFCLGARFMSSDIFSIRKFLYPFLIINAILILFILSSNLLINGVEIHAHSISRSPGPYYWVIQIYISACVSAGIILIWRSIYKSNSKLDKKRRIVILFSFIPIIFSVLLVILLMQLGLDITWSLFLPVTTLFFVVVYLYTENKNDLFKFLVNIPYSNERKTYNQLTSHILEYISKTQTDEPVSLKNMMAEIEKIFVNNALEIKDGNHNLAAELLSISLSTVYRHKNKIKPESGTDE